MQSDHEILRIKQRKLGFKCLAASAVFALLSCINSFYRDPSPSIDFTTQGFLNLAICLGIFGVLLIFFANKGARSKSISQKPSYYVIQEDRDRYSLVMRNDVFELSVPTGNVGPGISVIHTLSDSEVVEYRRNGISTLEDRISDMNNNMTKYTMRSWR
ncbi:hypothetical protein [Rubritalea sp.]|uniref:hypothetical protein n=1 Tax=Rubritalea sp. TaxID=2109375 RepID=UPI003EF97B34